jgi:hypothetical protein
MMNSKNSAARTEVGPHNAIRVAMEDLPEAQGRVLKMELEEEMAEASRRKLVCFKKNTHGGDQENHPGHHNYGNRYTHGNS